MANYNRRNDMVGRQEEIRELQERYAGSEAEFIAIYGRRRVGKTYLVDETFKGKITFRHAGLLRNLAEII